MTGSGSFEGMPWDTFPYHVQALILQYSCFHYYDPIDFRYKMTNGFTAPAPFTIGLYNDHGAFGGLCGRFDKYSARRIALVSKEFNLFAQLMFILRTNKALNMKYRVEYWIYCTYGRLEALQRDNIVVTQAIKLVPDIFRTMLAFDMSVSGYDLLTNKYVPLPIVPGEYNYCQVFLIVDNKKFYNRDEDCWYSCGPVNNAWEMYCFCKLIKALVPASRGF